MRASTAQPRREHTQRMCVRVIIALARAARTLYSSNTGKIALQKTGRNVSGSSCRALASIFAHFLCVASDICASLSARGIVLSNGIVGAIVRDVAGVGDCEARRARKVSF